MRDRNLNASYFQDAISNRNQFISFFKAKMANTSNNSDLAIHHHSLRMWYFEKFMLEYSLGLTQFSFNWEDYLNSFSLMTEDLINYNDLLQGVSLGIIFNASPEDLAYLKDRAISRREYDDLLRLLCTDEGSNESSQMRAIIPENNDLIQGMETKNPQFIMNYLNSWYKSNEGEYWHGEHTDSEGLAYIGYWCIEAAAAVKKFNIPYDSIRNHKYFPVEMVEM